MIHAEQSANASVAWQVVGEEDDDSAMWAWWNLYEFQRPDRESQHLGQCSIQQGSQESIGRGASIHEKLSDSSTQSDRAETRRSAHRAGLISIPEDHKPWSNWV